MKYKLLLLASVILVSCQSKSTDQTNSEAASTSEKPVEGTSFVGEPLYRKVANPEFIVKNDSLLEMLIKKSALTEDDYIEAGRLHTAVNRYHDAIDVYTKGIEKFPNSFKLLRHRGHRYMSAREFESAIVDLRRGDDILGTDDSVLEHNQDGYATGSYKYWIWYHIGLYHFFHGDYEQGAEAFENCLSLAIDNKNRTGSRSWLFETYQKLGDVDRARDIIAPITADFDVDQEYSYFKKIMLYKGILQPDDLVDLNKVTSEWTGGDISRAYGVAIWHSINDRKEEALAVYQKILETPHWNSWAYVMTDYEVNVVLKP